MTETASGGTPLLPRAVVLAQKEHTEDAYVSPVSIWEMAIKHRIGKLALPTEDVESAIAEQGFGWLPYSPRMRKPFRTAGASSRSFRSIADGAGYG